MKVRAVQSMTGSGAVTGDCEIGRVAVEFRSVNGRNLSVRSRLGSECARFETAVDAMVRARLSRGSVAVAVDVVEPIRSLTPNIDAAAFGAAASSLAKLAAASELKPPVVRDVLTIPGVVGSGSSGPDRGRTSAELPPALGALFAQALETLEARRVGEGAEMVKALRGALDALTQLLAEVRQRAPEFVAEHRSALIARVNEFLDEHGTRLEPDAVIRELAVFADRADITEEIERLDAHVTRMREVLDAGVGPAGREIEFLLQEILREVNTLGSKSPDVAMAHHVVAMKSQVDKLKEQAANIE